MALPHSSPRRGTGLLHHTGVPLSPRSQFADAGSCAEWQGLIPFQQDLESTTIFESGSQRLLLLNHHPNASRTSFYSKHAIHFVHSGPSCKPIHSGVRRVPRKIWSISKLLVMWDRNHKFAMSG